MEEREIAIVWLVNTENSVFVRDTYGVPRLADGEIWVGGDGV